MGVELYFSNRLVQLGRKLSENLCDENGGKKNIFTPTTLIVANSNLKKWLQMDVAVNIGVAINIDFAFLENGLWNMVRSVDRRKQAVELLDNDMRQLMLLFFLQDGLECDERMAPIQRYLLTVDRGRMGGYARRALQLSSRLSRYFCEYEYNRPEMIKRWLSDTDAGSQRLGEMELCQSFIYRELFHPVDGLCVRVNGKRYMTLFQYASTVFGDVMKNAAPPPLSSSRPEKTERSVHLFGLSQVSRFHQCLIANLGRHYDIHIYAFNPCCEFWEDVETHGERRWRMKKMRGELEISGEEAMAGELEEPDNPLLRWWGKPGRESIRLLSEITDYNFYELFDMNDSRELRDDTVLQRLQRNIMFRSPVGDGRPFPVRQDRSVQIAACPGMYREVETVYNSIIYNMSEDDGLKLTDIAVIVPDMAAYKTAITSIFSRSPSHILYNLCDSTAEKESIFAQAVTGLLDLALGGFTRREVFSVIFNPCFLETFDLRRDDVQVWLEWADTLNIIHGFDLYDRQRQGYSSSVVHTWRHGLRRLRMARIMGQAEEGGVDGGLDEYAGVVPPGISSLDSMVQLERFCDVVELLFAGISALRSDGLSGKDWAERICGVIDQFLSIPDQYASEERVRQSLIESLKGLEFYDKFYSGYCAGNPAEDSERQQHNSGAHRFDLTMAAEFVRQRLKSISSGYGSYLTGGVTVSAMKPMRPVPFKIVYIMGMGEGKFPGRADMSTLDLRLKGRKIGDVSRPEVSCYTFLEIVASTSRKLYLSYVSRDIQTEKDFVACSVINQLRWYIESEIIPGGEAFRITDVPLKGSDAVYFTSDTDHASDVIVNYSEADYLAYCIENGLFERVEKGLSGEEAKRVARFRPVFETKTDGAAAPSPPEHDAERVTLRLLRQFLEDPGKTHMQYRLGLYGTQDMDKLLVENEPFFSTFPLDYRMVKESLDYCLAAGVEGGTCLSGSDDMPSSATDFLNARYKSCFLQGLTPEGGFGVRDKRTFERTLTDRLPTIEKIVGEIRSGTRRYGIVVVGDGDAKGYDVNNAAGDELRFPPLQFEIGGVTGCAGRPAVRRVLMHGSLQMVWQDGTGWNTAVLTTSDKPGGKLPDKYVIGPFLFYLMLLSAGDSADSFAGSPFTIHLIYKERVKVWRYNMSCVDAREYIVGLLSDCLNSERADIMPFEAVKAIAARLNIFNNTGGDDGNAGGVTTDAGQCRSMLREWLSANWTYELPEMVRLCKADVPEDVMEKAVSRFSYIFAADA